MSRKHFAQSLLFVTFLAVLLCMVGGCSFAQAGAADSGTLAEEVEGASSIYGDWQNTSDLVEEQLMRSSGAERADGSGNSVETGSPRESRFRNTTEGEPAAIHQFVNRVIVDDEFVKITLQAKTADSLGDAGFTLVVENKYKPLTAVGYDNYCYITPVMGTWTVQGVSVDPKTEGQVYPGKPNTIYLYFDDFNTIEQLVDIKGQFEVYLISDWWNPAGVYEFSQT